MSYTEQEIEAAWQNGQIVGKFPPAKWRKDACGAWLSREQYGNHNSMFGWEIDRITPETQGSTDAPPTLLPLQWKNAALKSNGRLTGAITAYGGENIELL